jgi:hypothetical protein
MQVQLAFIAGLLVAFALIPLNRILGSAIANASCSMLKYKDARLDVVSTMLDHLRSIALMGWQGVLVDQVCPQMVKCMQLVFSACTSDSHVAYELGRSTFVWTS